MKNKINKKMLYILFILLLVCIDQIIKIILMQTTDLKNQLSLSSNNNYYIIVSIIIIILIIRYILNDNSFINNSTRIVLGFGIAGAIGNLIDRIFIAKVINYIKISSNLYINLAYIYIAIAWIGMAVILTKNTFKFIKTGKDRKSIK
jgi:lipoprotein signal peptidase